MRVSAGKYVYSASQLKTFDRCERKWAFEKIEGFRPPPSKSQELGTRVHKVIEDYLAGAVDAFRPNESKEHKIAFPGFQFWPHRRDILGIESKLSLSVAGCPFTGYIDVDAYIGPRVDGHPLVIDHKTTSDFKWALTPDELASDIQQTLYSADALQRSGADKVEARWIYYLTKGKPEARKVSVTLPSEQVEHNLVRVEDLVRRMEKARFADAANDLQPNVEACADYGGCPHRHRCERTPLASLTSAFEIADRREEAKRKEKEMQPRKPKLPPPRVNELPPQPATVPVPVAAEPAARPGMDPQAVLASWPQDADDETPTPPTQHVEDLPPAQALGTVQPRTRPKLPGAAAASLAPATPPAAAPSPPAPVPARQAPPLPVAPRTEPARAVLPPEAPKSIAAQEDLSRAQHRVIQSNLSKADKAEVIANVVEAKVKSPEVSATDLASEDIRTRLVERFGGKASKDMKSAYLQLLAACIQAGRPLDYADQAMESYFELFGK